MTTNDFITIDSIIAEVSSIVNDAEFSNGFSKGWYISRGRDALDELAYDTFIQKVTADLVINKDKLAVEMPSGCFNIREMYAFNGTCSPSTSKIVYWKRNYNNRGNGSSHTAKIKEGQSNYNDPFHPSGSHVNNCNTVCYANIENGTIMLSSNLSSYDKLRIVYNGTVGDVTDVPVIPRFFKRAVVDFITERYYLAMTSRNPRLFRSIWNDSFQKSQVSMQRARIRVSSMNTWEKESLEEYISNMIHK